MSRPRLPWCLVVLCAVTVAGCASASYPKDQVRHTLESFLQDEHLTAQVRLVERTLVVHVDAAGTLTRADEQIGLGPEFDTTIRKTLQNVHRVLLSTDAVIRFYVVLVSDPGVPGAYLTMVRYTDDVRRANVNMFTTDEMFARTIFEVTDVGAQQVNIDEYVPRDIELEEFLSWQLARRLQHELADSLQETDIAGVGRCAGAFDQGEFVFTLNVVPGAAGALDEPTTQQVFQAATRVIARVLSSYDFEAFNAVRLILPGANRNLVLPKQQLTVFK